MNKLYCSCGRRRGRSDAALSLVARRPAALWLACVCLASVVCAPPVLAQKGAQTEPPPPPPPPAGSGATRPRRITPAAQTPNATSGARAPETAPGDDEEVLTVDTQLVTVPVVVRDAGGSALANIDRNRFRVFEDNRPQQLASFSTTETPFEVALVIDTSGSTRNELNLIRRAANLFIDSLRPGDRVALVGFTTVEEEGERLARVEVRQPLTDDRRLLRDAVAALDRSNGTPFYDALEKVAEEVFDKAPAPELRGRRAVVALTDGVDSTSDAEFREARARLLPRGVVCYFVQVNTESYVEDRILQDCSTDGRLALSQVQLARYRRLFAPFLDRDDVSDFCRLGPFQRMQISRSLYQLARNEMTDLARATGGAVFPTIDLRDARRAFSEVAAAIGTQYSLGYYSTNKARDGKFRRIRVEIAGAPGAQVQAREGYTAPGAPPAK